MSRIRITVVKCLEVPDLAEKFASSGHWGKCWLKEGQVFEVEGGSDYPTPDGFCSWAWADIQRDEAWVSLSGIQSQHKVPGTAIACCTDGLNTVFFRFEPLGKLADG